jgi:hypothetical protein
MFSDWLKKTFLEQNRDQHERVEHIKWNMKRKCWRDILGLLKYGSINSKFQKLLEQLMVLSGMIMIWQLDSNIEEKKDFNIFSWKSRKQSERTI